jgi:hypothetical protein
MRQNTAIYGYVPRIAAALLATPWQFIKWVENRIWGNGPQREMKTTFEYWTLESINPKLMICV